MNKSELLNKLFSESGLTAEDHFNHKHYSIITRSGIEKIQAYNKIIISYVLEKCERDFAVIKAVAHKQKDNVSIETYGSALYGGKVKKGDKWVDTGNTNSHYVVELAEKRALSRAVLKLSGMYEHGVFGEDESEQFKRS